MTRALIVEPAGNLWGSERALLDFVARMPNIEAAVCCPPEVPLIAELKKLSIRTFPFYISDLHEKSRIRRLWAAVGVIRACLHLRPTAIYLNQGGCYRVALPAAVLLNLPIVAHVRIFEDVAYFSARRPNPRRLLGLIAISSSIAEALGRQRTLAPIAQHMIYDAYVPLARASEPAAAKRIFTRVACSSRIVPGKGQDLLIAAVHRLAENGDDIDCVIMGDGPLGFVEELKAAARNGAGAALIRWLGARADVVSLLAACGVVVCPSHREPLGRVIFEAWDAGAVPVACEKSGGAAEIIAAADGGILYAEQTPESLAKALLAATRLPHAEAARLVGNGRSWMSKHCDPVAYGAAMSKVLRDAAQRR